MILWVLCAADEVGSEDSKAEVSISDAGSEVKR